MDSVSNSYLYRYFMIFLDEGGYLDSELTMVLAKIKVNYIEFLHQFHQKKQLGDILNEVISL